MSRVSSECECVRGPSTQWFSSHVVCATNKRVRTRSYHYFFLYFFFPFCTDITRVFVSLNYSEFSQRAREYYDYNGRIARIHNIRALICSRTGHGTRPKVVLFFCIHSVDPPLAADLHTKHDDNISNSGWSPPLIAWIYWKICAGRMEKYCRPINIIKLVLTARTVYCTSVSWMNQKQKRSKKRRHHAHWMLHSILKFKDRFKLNEFGIPRIEKKKKRECKIHQFGFGWFEFVAKTNSETLKNNNQNERTNVVVGLP